MIAAKAKKKITKPRAMEKILRKARNSELNFAKYEPERENQSAITIGLEIAMLKPTRTELPDLISPS